MEYNKGFFFGTSPPHYSQPLVSASTTQNTRTLHSCIQFQVELYQTHWWRCNGRCQGRSPHFGIIRRSMNRAPGPSDNWWSAHSRNCGGTFVKIKDPEKEQQSNVTTKPYADITKYLTNNINTINNNVPNSKQVLGDSSNIKKNRTNNSHSVVVINKQVRTVPNSDIKAVFTGNGHALTGSNPHSASVTETVRNMWTKKIINKKTGAYEEPVWGISNPKKHKPLPDLQNRPAKVKKIDDYFESKKILKDLYGDDYKLTQANNSQKLIAVNLKVELVECPVCNRKFKSDKINTHLDECLNKDIIEKLSKDDMEVVQETSSSYVKTGTETVYKPEPKEIKHVTPPIPFKPEAALTPVLEDIKYDPIDLTLIDTKTEGTATNAIPAIPAYKPIPPLPECSKNNLIDLTDTIFKTDEINNKCERKAVSNPKTQFVNINTVTALVEGMNDVKTASGKKRRHTDSFINTNREDYKPSGVEKDKIDVKAGPSTEEVFDKTCPCCGEKFFEEIEEHLDECLMFFDNSAIPDESATILIEDKDNRFNESMIFNATGTKTPCPCCLKMVERRDMNKHLDSCLQS